MAPGPLFEQAAEQWNLARLCVDLAAAKAALMPHKRGELTDTEQARLRGLLLGYSPADIAEQQYATARTVEVALSQGLYRYIEQLVGRDRNSLTSWRDVVPWLEQAGYRCGQLAINWSQMPDVASLYGRQVELDQLKGWLLGASPCRLVAITGPAGIGKTTLAISLAKTIQHHFEGLIWQSLRHRPTLEHLLGGWLQQMPEAAPASDEWYDRLSAVIAYLQQHRCLVILDNLESILTGRSLVGGYEPGYEPYGELLKQLGEAPHQSCVIVTSRERNRETRGFQAPSSPVRYLSLEGLPYADAAQILEQERLSSQAQSYWKSLVTQYRGNPLMLRIVAMTIQEVFGGDVRRFLGQRMTLFGDIKYLIDQQYERLSDTEQEILGQLAATAEPLPIEQLQHPRSLEAVSALLRRSLIEKSAAGFTLIPVVTEYVRNHLP